MRPSVVRMVIWRKAERPRRRDGTPKPIAAIISPEADWQMRRRASSSRGLTASLAS
jgi:hypothetical protein